MTDKANKDLAAHQGKAYMTMPIDDALIQKAYECLVKSRMSLLFKHPFFGQLALRLTLTPANNTGNHFVAGVAILGGKTPAFATTAPAN